MVKTTIVNESKVERTARVIQVGSMFDVPIEQKTRLEWEVDMPLEEREWSVGLVVGPSGCGKSTVARNLWPDRIVYGHEWSDEGSVLDGFPAEMGIKDVVGMLTAVGFSSPPAWLRPFRTLSNGEQFRVTIARALAEMDDSGPIVVDEFTSVVDRQVAKVASHTTQKAVRRAGRQFIAVTCHYDVVEWLQPDWVYQPADRTFTWRSVQPRPRFNLDVHPVDRSCWSLFRHHHYLSGELASGAHSFGGFIEGECVAFTSYLHFPHPRTRNIKMGHRLVVLPDWQGLGIGGRLDDWLGEHLWAQGMRYHNTVSHPAMVRTYLASPRWRLLNSPKGDGSVKERRRLQTSTKNAAMRKRMLDSRALCTWSFAYTPPKEQA